MASEKFLKGLDFCQKHAFCPKSCPLYGECSGAYDMLYKTFGYVQELTEENERLKAEKEK